MPRRNQSASGDLSAMQINLIWAQAHGGVIGKDGAIPWHLPEDLAHFKRTTLGCPVIMGRKTWDSLPPRFRPLPGRLNMVITRQIDWAENNVSRMSSLSEALLFCKQMTTPPSTVWVIGGAQIYARALPFAQQIVVTQIDAALEGDSFAPPLPSHWPHTATPQQTAANGMGYQFFTYTNPQPQALEI
jgi:dihydrofolate reductase